MESLSFLSPGGWAVLCAVYVVCGVLLWCLGTVAAESADE